MGNKKTIVGLVERITLHGARHQKTLLAKIDTGATKSSVDAALARELDLGPPIKERVIRAAHGARKRAIVKARVDVAGRSMTAEFSIADRSRMKYRALIGQNVLKRGFLIDPGIPIPDHVANNADMREGCA